MAHVEGHVEVETQASSGTAQKSRMDPWFERTQKYITDSIQRFVASLFILISAGAVIGFMLAQRPGGEFLIIVPAVAGLIAYYNRDFAMVVFSIVILLIFII